ncbi:MAG: hypothetical protein ACR2MB_14655 [Acidimicrobiales bacterium]
MTPLRRAASVVDAGVCVGFVYFGNEFRGDSWWWWLVFVPYALLMLGSAAFFATSAITGRRYGPVAPGEERSN